MPSPEGRTGSATGPNERALGEQGWSLFDFRELRRWAIGQSDLDPRLLRLFFGFDVAVLIPEGTPSDQIQ
jgi:hypothetical protein